LKEKVPLPVLLGRYFFKRRSWLGAIFYLFAIIFFDATSTSIIAGIFLILLGEFLRLVSVAYSGPTTRSRSFVAPRLVVEGPYSVVRNPIYWGNFFIGLGFLITTNALVPILQLVYILLFFLYYGAIVLAEEDFLKRRFGTQYTRYFEEVPRFIPRHPFRWKGGQPDWQEALRSEKSTFILISLWLLLVMVLDLIKGL
jgi:protein-S-isoprenylcysteine O-methyltransferase Ste14